MFKHGDEVVLTPEGVRAIGWWWNAHIGEGKPGIVVGVRHHYAKVRRLDGGSGNIPHDYLTLHGPPTTVRAMSHKVYQAAM